MKQILDRWRNYINEGNLKEVRHLDSDYLPTEFINKFNSLPVSDVVKDFVKEYGIDFSFELYDPKTPIKFFVPLPGGEMLFDFSKQYENVVRKPTKKEEEEKGNTIPVLPNDWYEYFLKRYEKAFVNETKIKIKNKKKKKDLSKITTLAVFDFDETLFQSDKAAKRQTTTHPLSPDSLPDKPKKSDWNMDIVLKAQEMCSNPSVYCVMMTGRVGKFFKEKIDNILKNENLLFAETHYNEFGGDTQEYKIKEIHNIIEKLPNVEKLIMWEDQQDNAEAYREEFSDKINFTIHLVGEKESL